MTNLILIVLLNWSQPCYCETQNQQPDTPSTQVVYVPIETVASLGTVHMRSMVIMVIQKLGKTTGPRYCVSTERDYIPKRRRQAADRRNQQNLANSLADAASARCSTIVVIREHL